MAEVYQSTLDLTADLPFEPPDAGLTAIYALCDPRDGAIRYIGKTIMPRTRQVVHVQPSVVARADYRARWLAKLKRAGVAPAMRILAWVSLDEWQEAERAYIEEARRQECDLVNTAVGGHGPMIRQKHTPETLAKMSASLKGHHKSAEWRAKIAAAHRGKPKNTPGNAKSIATHRTPEYRAHIAEITRQGHANDPDERAKRWRAEHPEEVAQQMAKRRAHLDDPEWHARWLEKHHALHLGRKRSPQACANIAAGKAAAASKRQNTR